MKTILYILLLVSSSSVFGQNYDYKAVNTISGSATYAASVSSSVTSYTTNLGVRIRFKNASSGASTLNLNGIGAKKIFKTPSVQAGSGDLIDEQVYDLIYDTALDGGTGGFLITTTPSAGGGGGGSGDMLAANNLSDLVSASSARTNLGLGTLATQSGTFSGTSSGTNTGDQDLSGLAVKSNNLADLTSASSARTNLGLGTLATQSGTFSGTSSGTNTGDQDLSGLAVKSNNLADLTSASSARTNLGLGTLATQSGTFSGTSSGTNTGDQDLSGLAVKSNNLSDLTSASTARTNLGLGTLATQSGTFSGTSSGTNTGDQDLSGLAVKSNNLSDLTNASTARTNLVLGNVDNTSDANKPVSTAQATALALKLSTTLNQNKVLIGNASNAATSYNASYLTPEQYGAVGDDATNDATAFGNLITAASALGVPIWIPAKTYLVGSTLTIPSNLRIIGSGAASILHTTSNVPIFTITSASNITITDLVFKGSSAGSTQRGIYAHGNVGFTQLSLQNIVSRCGFINFGADGIYADYVIGSSSGSNHEGTYQISDSWFTGCANGVFFDVRGEYNQISNCKFYLNTTGVRMNAGNCHVNNNSITDNTTGIIVGSGTNDGHAMAIGNKINHNGSNITCTSTATGYAFIGNEIIAGSITLNTCTDIRFYDNDISTAPVTSTNAVGSYFANNCFRTTPTITVASGNNPTFFGNTFPAGTVHALAINTIAGQMQFTTSGSTGQLEIRNPANTFSYKIGGGAIVTADRNVNFPVITSNETFVLTAVAQTLANKTLGSGTTLTVSPTISDGLRITFNPDNTSPGLNVGVNATDPSAATNADFWNNSTTGFNMMRHANTNLVMDGSLIASGTLDFPSVASLGNQVLTITVTGAADGDVVTLGIPNGSKTAGLIFTTWVSASNTVSIEAYNSTGIAIDPASGTFKVRVIK